MQTLRSALREATSASHRELDGVVGGLEPFSSPSKYAVYLRTMRSLHQQFASEVDIASRLVGLPEASNALVVCLTADLEGLPDQQSDDLPLVVSESDEKTKPHDDWAIGVGYTLEGSALGAQQLVKVAQRDLPAGTPASYLAALAEGASTRWPVYAKHLQESVAEVETAVAGALTVFVAAKKLFAEAASKFRENC